MVDTSRRSDLLAGLALAALVVCIMAGERFETAVATVDAIEESGADTGNVAGEAAPDRLALAWGLVTILGGILACLVARVVVRTARKLAEAGLPEGNALTAAQAAQRRRVRRRLAILTALVRAAIVAWLLWMVTGTIEADGADLSGWRGHVHAAAVALALLAVLGAGREVVGDVQEAWDRASLVRLQIIVLAAVFALVVLVPLTSAQATDVLRAWGDGNVSRAASGIAAALLLGAVCRASAVRLLTPPGVAGLDHVRRAGARVARIRVVRPVVSADPVRRLAARVWPVASILIPGSVAVALAVAGLWPLAYAMAAVTVVGVVTQDAPRPLLSGESEDERLSLRRLAGTLGVLPLAIVLVGLTIALVDSLLLPSPLSGAEMRLLAYTGVVAVAFGLLAGAAHWWDGEETLSGSGSRLGAALGIIGFVAAAAPGWMLDPSDDLVFLPSLVLLALGALLAARTFGERGAPELWAGWGVALGTALAVLADPVDAGRVVGAFALVFIAATGALVLLHVAASVGARRSPVEKLRLLLPRRVPVVSLLAVWVAIAWIDAAPTAHQARTVATEGRPGSLAGAVRRWLDRESAGGEDFLPMLIVAASGGGSKAAYWTDLVLDCAFGAGYPRSGAGECAGTEDPAEGATRFGRLFLTSSVSGGSVGVYHLGAHRDAILAGRDWVDPAAGTEVLSPAVGWGLFHDMPAFMLGLSTNPADCDGDGSCRLHADRALVQEAAISGADGLDMPDGDGLLSDDADGPDAPITIFNGALDGADARVLISPLALAPRRHPDPGCRAQPTAGAPAAGSFDAHSMLREGRDVAGVTAAMLSARFPVVAPAARLGEGGAGDASHCAARRPLPPVHVRDGGYIENSGLLTVTELLPSITAAIADWRGDGHEDVQVRPIVVSIDDDPTVAAANPRLVERPREAAGIAKRAGPGYLTRLARERLDSCQYAGVSYIPISPPPRAGAHAATGWELSETVRDEDLAATLRDDGLPRDRLDLLRHILDGDYRPTVCR